MMKLFRFTFRNDSRIRKCSDVYKISAGSSAAEFVADLSKMLSDGAVAKRRNPTCKTERTGNIFEATFPLQINIKKLIIKC